MLKQNLRYFEGFLNRENVLPKVEIVMFTLRDMLISNTRGLEMLRDLSMIVKNHVPLVDAPLWTINMMPSVPKLMLAL